MSFGKKNRKNTDAGPRKSAEDRRRKLRLSRALAEDHSVRGECRTAEDAEDIYDEDDFDE